MNEKNLAPKNIEGTYTLTIEGKTITITDSSGHTKTANCAPMIRLTLAKVLIWQ